MDRKGLVGKNTRVPSTWFCSSLHGLALRDRSIFLVISGLNISSFTSLSRQTRDDSHNTLSLYSFLSPFFTQAELNEQRMQGITHRNNFRCPFLWLLFNLIVSFDATSNIGLWVVRRKSAI